MSLVSDSFSSAGLPDRFLALDAAPLLDVLEQRTPGLGRLPSSGSLRVRLLEAKCVLHGRSNNKGSPGILSAVRRTSSTGLDALLDREDKEDRAASEGSVFSGAAVFALVDYALGSKSVRTAAVRATEDDGAVWDAHGGTVVCELKAAMEALTIRLRRRGVPGRNGLLGIAHFKLMWLPGGGASLFYTDADGTPQLYKLAFEAPSDARYRAAGVAFSNVGGRGELWLPLLHSPGGSEAAVRVELSVDWFGDKLERTAEELKAVLLLQRYVRGWKARRRLGMASNLKSAVAATELAAVVQKVRGLPLKSNYSLLVTVQPTVLGSPAAAKLQACPPLRTSVFSACSSEPVYGESLVLDLAKLGGLRSVLATKPVLRVRVVRKDVTAAYSDIVLSESLLAAGQARRLWHPLKPGPGHKLLEQRAAHKLKSVKRTPQPLSCLLYVCVLNGTQKPAQ